MKRILKLNSQYPISIGLILMGIGGVFFDSRSDIGLVITLLGGIIIIAGAIIGFYQTKKDKSIWRDKLKTTCLN